MAPEGLSEYEISNCCQLTPIDTSKVPNYKKLFIESEIKPPAFEKNDKTFFENSVESEL